jgi:hypothetical protein
VMPRLRPPEELEMHAIDIPQNVGVAFHRSRTLIGRGWNADTGLDLAAVGAFRFAIDRRFAPPVEVRRQLSSVKHHRVSCNRNF